MADLSAPVVAQWGGFGAVLIACAFAIWKLYGELLKQRESEKATEEKMRAAEKKTLAEHAEAMQRIQAAHAQAVSALQNERTAQLLEMTDRLMSLQAKFNESISAMSQQMQKHVWAEDQVFQIMTTFDRRLETIERKVVR
jgi:F0F1-type ATP synthase membrane subunit b/b'